MMPTKFLRLTSRKAKAMLQFYDEIKLFAAMEDQMRFENGTQTNTRALDDADWVEETYEKLWREWSEEELAPLNELRDEMASMFEKGKSYFVKLSVRSPKDAAMKIKPVMDGLKKALSGMAPVQTKMRIFAEQCSKALRSNDPDYCLKLFLLSDRVNTDLRAHCLFLDEGEEFSLQLAFREWYDWLHPYFEFRTFVVKGELTAITAYEMFSYDPILVQEKNKIRTNLVEFWKQHCKSQIRSENYCVDFCINPKNLDQICLIEVNNFLPPLAGTGQFLWHRKEDREEVMNPPLSFRVPLHPSDSFERKYEVDDGKQILYKIPGEFEKILKDVSHKTRVQNLSIAAVLV